MIQSNKWRYAIRLSVYYEGQEEGYKLFNGTSRTNVFYAIQSFLIDKLLSRKYFFIVPAELAYSFQEFFDGHRLEDRMYIRVKD